MRSRESLNSWQVVRSSLRNHSRAVFGEPLAGFAAAFTPSSPPRVAVDPKVMRGAACMAGSRLPSATLVAMVVAAKAGSASSRADPGSRHSTWMQPGHGSRPAARTHEPSVLYRPSRHEVPAAWSPLHLHVCDADSGDLAALESCRKLQT
jgi:hypothetical protein